MFQQKPNVLIDPPANKRLTDFLATAGLATMAGVILSYWGDLPDKIPTHFNSYGVPDGWGSRYSIFGLPVIGLFLFWLINYAAKRPTLLNIPLKVTEANAKRLYELAASMANWLKVVVVWMFCFLVWQTSLVSVGKAAGMNDSFVLAGLGVIFAIAGVYLMKMRKAR